jgi:hypothetical protein
MSFENIEIVFSSYATVLFHELLKIIHLVLVVRVI